MKPLSDLNAILKEGYSFQYDMSGCGIQDVSISTHQLGELILTSGKLLAWDFLIGPDERYSFKKSLEPGRYPVVVSVADFLPTGETRIACATLRISNEQAVNWEVALINDPSTEQDEGIDAYGVDSGTGSFMDVDAAQAFCDLVWGPSGDDKFEEYCDRVIREMEGHSFGEHGSANWADIRLGDATEANIITFSSGWGDGGYASFWGYDAAGELACLATDFALFYTG